MAGPHAETTAYPATLDRRLHAFLIDRLVAWGLYAVAGWVAWAVWFSNDAVLPGVLLIVGVVLLVGLTFAIVLGLTGSSPGRAVTGLRVVHAGTGVPIGVGPALLRTLVLGAATLPTFGLGVATLAQTAAVDPGRQRRGWHDRVAGSVVVDVRPGPAHPETVTETPRQIVNLTAMRLVPARQADPPASPTQLPSPPVAWRQPPSPTPAATWRVRFDTGETFLVEGLGLVGRRPEPRAGEPVRHLVALPSTDMSLSKTHAQFQVAPDGVLVVMDRGSTNGSTLVRSGVARNLPVGRPTTLVTGDEVKFGDRTMQVFREG